jgi:hypothetical protein
MRNTINQLRNHSVVRGCVGNDATLAKMGSAIRLVEVPGGYRSLRVSMRMTTFEEPAGWANIRKPREAARSERLTSAIRQLNCDSDLDEVVIESYIGDSSREFDFHLYSFYVSGATRAGFKVARVVRQNRMGFEHLIVVTREVFRQ